MEKWTACELSHSKGSEDLNTSDVIFLFLFLNFQKNYTCFFSVEMGY